MDKEEHFQKKKIENPYNLNPNNYVYLVIPVFDNIELIQNNSIQGSFAKILLTGESNKTLFNTYTSASKIFTNNLKGTIDYKNNNIFRLRLDSLFPNNKKLSLTIKTNDNNEKITTLFAGNPKPLVKQYKFIKGFEEGVMDFYSIKKDGISNSVLKIDNFKVQEVPALAKLLTLASLQGIADLLTGEGIRFTDFEMKFSNKKNVIIIEELYAIGPAISILMDGYIQNN